MFNKEALEQIGINVDLIYTGEFFQNTSGGIDTNDAGNYRGDVSLFVEVDTAAAGLWEDGLFFLQLQHQHGKGITNDYVGDFQVLSNIDADDFTQLSEIWYLHSFLDDRLWIKLGKMEANADFAFVDFGGEFINSSPGFSPTIPLATFPDQDWGIVLGVQPVDWFSMNIGVYQGRPDGGRSITHTLNELYGPMVLVEPAFHYSIAGLPGHFRLGGWWNGDEFDRIEANVKTPLTYGEAYGIYATLEQTVWKENPDDEEDEQGVGVFAQMGWSPEDRCEVDQYYGVGVQWIGAFPNRDDDVVGAGIFHVEFSDEAGFVDDGETVFELFYKYQLAGWMSIKPDLQYIANPGGMGNDDAIAIGVRWEIVF